MANLQTIAQALGIPRPASEEQVIAAWDDLKPGGKRYQEFYEQGVAEGRAGEIERICGLVEYGCTLGRGEDALELAKCGMSLAEGKMSLRILGPAPAGGA